MASIVDFDASVLDALLKTHGLRKTWISILATTFRGRTDLAYIFQSPEFQDAEIFDVDLIEGLSIGEVSVLYEYSHATYDADARKSNGQFFTPDDVAIFMARFSDRFPKGKWLDPCSGIGNLSWHLVSLQKNPEEFLATNMLLSDRDELALLIARTFLVASFQRKYKTLFHDIKQHFIVLDFLSIADNQETKQNELSVIPSHDFVIVNPPYLATKARDMRFETGRSSDLYAYFLENIIKTSRGFISVTPQSFTNAGKFVELRRLLLNHYENLTILNFDNIPGNIFRGIKFGSKNSNTSNSIRAAITIALPGKGERRITSLFRWRTSERLQLFTDVEKFLSTVPLAEEYFAKVSAVFQPLYMQLLEEPKLSQYVSKSATDFPLYIPSSPRYFIPALKNGVQRASQRTLYFKTTEDRDKAYLLINSSLMYWWWRVRDGGMTLSQETLFSLPMPDFKVNKKLVTLLEKSEVENKVYKMNAGSAQENVKHPMTLVAQLNEAIIPEYAERLILTHENTEFAQTTFLPK